MFLPLLLLHIPALVAYLRTDHVQKDMYAVRKNACSVLREYVTLAATGTTRMDHMDQIRQALEKCKADTHDVASITYTSLLVMHDALSKKSPILQRPVNDPCDACRIVAWNHETSFIRELFGMQCDHPALGLTHPFVVDVRQQEPHASLAQNIRNTLGNTTTIMRAPLVLVCLMQPGTSFTLDLVFGTIQYTLAALATSDCVVVKGTSSWQEHHAQGCTRVSQLQDIFAYKAQVVVYQRV